MGVFLLLGQIDRVGLGGLDPLAGDLDVYSCHGSELEDLIQSN